MFWILLYVPWLYHLNVHEFRHKNRIAGESITHRLVLYGDCMLKVKSKSSWWIPKRSTSIPANKTKIQIKIICSELSSDKSENHFKTYLGPKGSEQENMIILL